MDKDWILFKERLHNVDKDVFFSVLSHIGDKWSLILLGVLSQKALRYNELVERIPKISRRMLTVTLRKLERDGLVERKVNEGPQAYFEYSVTELGRTLIVPVRALGNWALENIEQITHNRETYDAENQVC